MMKWSEACSVGVLSPNLHRPSYSHRRIWAIGSRMSRLAKKWLQHTTMILVNHTRPADRSAWTWPRVLQASEAGFFPRTWCNKPLNNVGAPIRGAIATRTYQLGPTMTQLVRFLHADSAGPSTIDFSQLGRSRKSSVRSVSKFSQITKMLSFFTRGPKSQKSKRTMSRRSPILARSSN